MTKDLTAKYRNMPASRWRHTEIKAFCTPEHANTSARDHTGRRDRNQTMTPPHAIFLTRKRISSLLALLLIGVITPRPATAEAIQDLDSIRRSATNFVLQATKQNTGKIEVEAGTLDPRLRLARCSVALEGFLPAGGKFSGNATVGLRCPGAKPWTLFVPVRIKIYAPVVVVARPVAKGTALQAADIRVEVRDLNALTAPPMTELNQAQGKLAMRPMEMGSILHASDVQPPRLVRRGERVTILASTGGLEVRANGEALSDGIQGEQISVRNTLTKQVIQATVASTGLVRVPL